VEPDRFLHPHRVQDRIVLRGAERRPVNPPGVKIAERQAERRRAQQAPDVIGVEGRAVRCRGHFIPVGR